VNSFHEVFAVRYRFRGMSRDSGRLVEGHVEADREEQAYMTLSDNGVIAESLVPDAALDALPPGAPHPPAVASGASVAPFTNAIDTALNNAASQVSVDAIAQRFKGKSVWVIDRDKIRQRVAQVVDQAIGQSMVGGEGSTAARERVAGAINDLFRDSRNLTSQATANNTALERQIARLGHVIRQAENLVASMTMAIGRIGSLPRGDGTPRRYNAKPVQQSEQNEVLAEIFKANLDLIRSLDQELAGAPMTAEVGATADSAAILTSEDSLAGAAVSQRSVSTAAQGR
jgi:hypothetical protein